MASKQEKAFRDDMTIEFWDGYYKDGSHPWHEKNVNKGLKANIETFINGRDHIVAFFPLCGKAVDMKWIYDLGHTVIGVEGSIQAIEEFFKESNLEYDVDGNKYSTPDKRLTIFAMNIFDYNVELMGEVSAVWDRGAFVAINFSERAKYSELMKSICTKDCRYILDVYEYDRSVYGGPPLCTTKEDIDEHFSSWCTSERIFESDEITDHWREVGFQSFMRYDYLLTPK
ncbi:unnamed protein product [Dimorphilus gyrociliatus]|uniref:thiopurine S-methyltransferase n=1 Tax=Dimorphilus gyrociliatus TaxID=2664684 RepID=A0A7I8VX97_9ANNE|nr:unnamed protein product [Dimorphilus gyrociliatus]